LCLSGAFFFEAALLSALFRLKSVAASIEEALKDAGIKADCSDLFSHLKIELPTAQLAAASAVLADLHLI